MNKETFRLNVYEEKTSYINRNHKNPQYLIINRTTFEYIKSDIKRVKMISLYEKIEYFKLNIAFDNELEDWEFRVVGG